MVSGVPINLSECGAPLEIKVDGVLTAVPIACVAPDLVSYAVDAAIKQIVLQGLATTLIVMQAAYSTDGSS
jgi:hypothetical protein